MKVPVVAWLVLASGSPAEAAPAAAEPVRTLAGVLERIDQAERAIRDVSLGFAQITTLRATADMQTTKGELSVIKQPERFHIRFLEPVRQEAAYDGASLTLYFPDAEQAYRQKATSQQLAAMLGVNPSEPVRSFRRGYAAALEGCGDGTCRLTFTRTAPADLVWHVSVSSKTWLMAEAWFENREIKVVLKCYDYRVNRKLKAASLRLTLPRGVDVQEGLPQMMGGPSAPEAPRAPGP